MRILGITLPEEKRLEIGLTVLYGIGRPLAKTILKKAKVDVGSKPKDVTVDQENTIRRIVEEYKIEGDLNEHHIPFSGSYFWKKRHAHES